MNVKFVVATKHRSREDTILGHHLEKTHPEIFYGMSGHHIEWHFQNTESLATVYNRAIERVFSLKECYTHIVFLHDDVIIHCKDIINRLEKSFERFDIVGLAGNTKVDGLVKDLHGNLKPVLWHLMAQRSDLVGCVAHGNLEKYMYTSFGYVNIQALMIDGLFIGVNLSKIGNLRFDTNNPAKFHFYDLNFSMDAALLKIKTGVVDIPVIHSSPGLREFTQEWKDGEKYFLSKYKHLIGKVIAV